MQDGEPGGAAQSAGRRWVIERGLFRGGAQSTSCLVVGAWEARVFASLHVNVVFVVGVYAYFSVEAD